ncbi:MAG: ferrous iron transport protein A [Nanoarchaeota archaeon]|nr:ferrous iron transport protein A [Nanoarchaeota archaeon]
MVKPIAEIKEGGECTIDCVECGKNLMSRMSCLGLLNGTKLRVLKNKGKGPILVKVLNSKMAIGRGQAEKILVSEDGEDQKKKN